MSDLGPAKYRALARLGQGGMAQVFLAIASGPVGFSKLVVLKEIRDEFADEPDFVTMFLDEARLAARLNHPNVVQTTEVGVDGKRYYICMEYLEGQPLNRIFGRLRGGELTVGMKVRILVDTLAGLHHAHEVCDLDGTPLQVVHRDATPHNVFLTYDGQVKVVDFGIAKALSSSTETRTGVLKGKVHYMAPEQANGEKVDRRADIFSIGMILWEVLVGHRPFRRMPDVAVMHKIMSGDIPTPRSVDPTVPEALDAVCRRALAHRRDDRYATAAEMAAALEEALDALGDRSSVRDAGKAIAREFAEDRESMKRLVEAQVALIQRASEGRSRRSSILPVVDYETAESKLAAPPMPPPTPTPSHGAVAIREDGQPSSITATFAGRSQAPPPDPTPPRSRRLAVVAVGASSALASIALVFALRGAPRPEPVTAVSPLTAEPAVAPTQAATAPTARTVTVDSMPQGAVVREGDTEIGTTPMVLKIDPAAPTPRRLVMSLPGYVPHTFLPTADDVRIQVPLTPLAAPPETTPKPQRKPARRLAEEINTAR